MTACVERMQGAERDKDESLFKDVSIGHNDLIAQIMVLENVKAFPSSGTMNSLCLDNDIMQ